MARRIFSTLAWVFPLTAWLGVPTWVPFPLFVLPVCILCALGLAFAAMALVAGERPVWVALAAIGAGLLLMLPLLIYLPVGVAAWVTGR